MRIHVVSLPHTQTTKAYDWCAYTAKVRKFCDMMMSLGHEVFLYAGEENEARCTELIPIVSKEDQAKWFANYDWKTDVFWGWDVEAVWWKIPNERAEKEIRKRMHKDDYVGLISGCCQVPLANMGLTTVEWGVGYSGVLNNTFRCFESYAWQHHVAGRLNNDEARFFDTVIPNSFELADFPLGHGGQDFVFLGRMIRRKGIQIAAQTCEILKAKLTFAGQCCAKAEPGKLTTQDGTELTGDVHHIGVVNPVERAKLLGSAKAVFVPTMYLEPFGGVAIEAMLCGTPVITSDWGAFTETVEHGVSGFRCRTLAEFVQAAKDVEKLDRNEVRTHALQYTTDEIRWKYDEWFKRLDTLRDKGWYTL